MKFDTKIEIQGSCETRKKACIPEIIDGSRMFQRQIEQAKELSHRFGLDRPEEISIVLRISINSALALQKYIETRK